MRNSFRLAGRQCEGFGQLIRAAALERSGVFQLRLANLALQLIPLAEFQRSRSVSFDAGGNASEEQSSSIVCPSTPR